MIYSIQNLLKIADEIKNEIRNKENTAVRIGATLRDLVESIVFFVEKNITTPDIPDEMLSQIIDSISQAQDAAEAGVQTANNAQTTATAAKNDLVAHKGLTTIVQGGTSYNIDSSHIIDLGEIGPYTSKPIDLNKLTTPGNVYKYKLVYGSVETCFLFVAYSNSTTMQILISGKGVETRKMSGNSSNYTWTPWQTNGGILLNGYPNNDFQIRFTRDSAEIRYQSGDSWGNWLPYITGGDSEA
ncbi:MAG: hypothetical protein LBF79_00645, partial [Dysgonamonadaceae bacterium]|nr:hypothetical protein [Dysgonamonadaceae bacterium]